MTKNIGGIESILRAIVGLGLIAIVFVGPHTPRGWLGLVPPGATLAGWSSHYVLLGTTTLKK